jgi:hypothetical protein
MRLSGFFAVQKNACITGEITSEMIDVRCLETSAEECTGKY